MSSQQKAYRKYNAGAMAEAIDMVRYGGMSKKRAALVYGVPRTTLIDKLSGRVPEVAKSGPSTVLTPAEEETLVNYVSLMASIGYPLSKANLLCEVKRALDRDCRNTLFTNNMPG